LLINACCAFCLLIQSSRDLIGLRLSYFFFTFD